LVTSIIISGETWQMLCYKFPNKIIKIRLKMNYFQTFTENGK
jgi:hypothetical protein